jgi:tetratricopeptide (TPR) repeat protein
MTETAELLQAMRGINGLLQARKIREAHDQLQAIVEGNPRYVEALRLLAGTKQALGDVAAAEGLLRRALTLDPHWTPTLATLGELLMMSGRAGDAEPLLQRAASGASPHPRAAFLLARHYNDTARPAQALAAAAPLCKSGRADADLAAQHIAALAALGRSQEAVAEYRRIAAETKNNPAASHALAIALNVANQHAEGERVALDTLARGYKSAALYNTYAGSLVARGALESAEAALQECLKLEPRLLDAHNNLAKLVWMRTGDAALSTAALDQALQKFADDDALWAAKAAILQGAGEARAAYACLSQRASRPQAPPMLLVRAGLAALEFDPAAALRLAERTLRLVADNSAAQTLSAAAYLGIGDARAALTRLETLLDKTADDQYLIAMQTTAWRLLGDERYAQYCDYARLVVPLQLEPPPGWTNLVAFLADVEVSLNRLHDPHGHRLLFQSLRHGTETTLDLSKSPDPVIQALFNAFAAPIREYLARLGAGTDPMRRRNHGRWRFNGSWSVRLRSAGHHTHHVHPRGWISSACYISLPDTMLDTRQPDGILTFGEPGIVTTPTLSGEHSVRPQAGMLVLFPSYVWHGTVPFRGDQPRLTVAFDVVPEP